MNFRKYAAPLLLSAAATVAVASPASAATAVYDFGANASGLNTSANPDTYSLTSNGLTVTARAYTGLTTVLSLGSVVNFDSPADVTHASNGLGVRSGRFDFNGEINDNGLLSTGEGILLVFNQTVELTQALFGAFGSGDTVGFEFGSPIAPGETLDALSAPGGTWNGSRTGTQFFFAANNLQGSSFRLDGVTVNYTPAAGAVPEPATWAMMILGFGLVGSFMRRRQRHPAVRFNFA